MNRRKLFKTTGAIIAGSAIVPALGCTGNTPAETLKEEKSNFRFCLNTSTIRGCTPTPSLKEYIDITAEAGYDGIELWVKDVKAYLEAGNSAEELKNYIAGKNLVVENAIGFAKWMAADEAVRTEGMTQLKEEMKMMASIGCKRIAAAPSGVDAPVDFKEAGKYFKEVIQLGLEIGIKPILEFWGAHEYFNHFGQILAVAAAANQPDVCLLPDIYHLFRGGSGFDCLKMVSGSAIEVFHMNDYSDSIPRLEQKDKDRVYPGDGAAPTTEILSSLKTMGGVKVLSIELFNPEYYKLDALTVAKTALEKLKAEVAKV